MNQSVKDGNLGSADSRSGVSKTQRKENRQALGVLSILFLLHVGLLYQPTQWIYDPSMYYAYIRSPVIDGDLDFWNEAEPKEFWAQVSPTVTGKCPNVWSVGPAFFWAPFFLAAHGVTLLGNQVGLSLPADGYSHIYVLFVGLSSAFYGLLGIWFIYKWLRRYFTHPVALLAAATTWMATPVFFYMYRFGMYAHSLSLTSVAFFIMFWDRTRGTHHWKRYFGLGFVAGLVTMIRWQNSLFLVLPAMEVGMESLQTIRLGQGWKTALQFTGSRLAILTFSALIAFSPQMAIWQVLYGHFLTIPQGADFMHWLEPQLGGVLFSSNRGLFLWEPLAALGMIGLVLFYRRQRFLTSCLLLAVALQIYVNSVAGDWWGGGGFGPRRFDSLGPILALGLAVLLKLVWSHDTWRRAVAIGGCLLLAVHQRVLMWLTYSGRLPWDLFLNGKPIPVRVFADGFLHALRHPQLLVQPEQGFHLSPFQIIYHGLVNQIGGAMWLQAGSALALAIFGLCILYVVGISIDSDKATIWKSHGLRIAQVTVFSLIMLIVGVDVGILLLA